MDVQEIERLHAEQVGALAGGRTHVGGAEVVDPQLRGDRDLVPVHVARGKPLGEPVTDDRLVAVDPGGVEVAVAERECGRDRLRVVDSHRSEADGRKVHAGLSDRPTQKPIGSTIERLCPVQIFSSVSTGVRPQMLTRSWRSSIS